MLIVLFGPDRSGKSSIAKLISENLASKDFKVHRAWMRGSHTLASLLAKLLSKFDTFKGNDNPYYSIAIPNCLKGFWQLIEFISVIPIILARFILPNILGYCVVAERYVPDFIVWNSIVTKDDSYANRFDARFLIALALKANVKVYVTAEINELYRRGEKDINFLRKQLTIYEKIAKNINAFKLDTTNKSVNESVNIILSFLIS